MESDTVNNIPILIFGKNDTFIYDTLRIINVTQRFFTVFHKYVNFKSTKIERTKWI